MSLIIYNGAIVVLGVSLRLGHCVSKNKMWRLLKRGNMVSARVKSMLQKAAAFLTTASLAFLIGLTVANATTSDVAERKIPLNTATVDFTYDAIAPTDAGLERIDLALDSPGGPVGKVQQVPLPSALPLFGTGLALLGFLAWRRKRKRAGIHLN